MSVIRNLIKLLVISSFMSLLTGLMSVSAANSIQQTNHPLTLETAVLSAQKNDPWLIGNRHTQDAVESMSLVAGTLPDPKVSLGIANIAADSFDFNQEAMTQFKVGYSQMFPRGQTLALKQKQLQLMASQYPFQRLDRQAKVAVLVAKLWLDAYKAQQSINLIENDRALFEQLADVAQAGYSSALGKTRQQDIIRAQLELTRLDDRLSQLRQHKEVSEQQLFEWLNTSNPLSAETDLSRNSSIELASQLPNIKLLHGALYSSTLNPDPQSLYAYFSKHPALNALQQKIKASQSGVDLAKQKYKPEWGVNAGYGVRGNSPAGMDRADLFSIGISFDLPLFTNQRQDKEVQSATSTAAATKTEQWLLLRKLIASFKTNRAQLLRLNQRQYLYQQRLLPQMRDQAEASLTAYTNDDGDFAEVVRSRIAELNAAIDALGINVERQKTIIQLNYFLMNSVSDMTQNLNQANARSGENK